MANNQRFLQPQDGVQRPVRHNIRIHIDTSVAFQNVVVEYVCLLHTLRGPPDKFLQFRTELCNVFISPYPNSPFRA
jgi:hypothetical protein